MVAPSPNPSPDPNPSHSYSITKCCKATLTLTLTLNLTWQAVQRRGRSKHSPSALKCPGTAPAKRRYTCGPGPTTCSYYCTELCDAVFVYEFPDVYIIYYVPRYIMYLVQCKEMLHCTIGTTTTQQWRSSPCQLCWLTTPRCLTGHTRATPVVTVTSSPHLILTLTLTLGNARRYFDFLVYGGENDGTERVLHHYGAPLNAIPILEAYRADPDNTTLLQVGLGGVVGSITNIASGSGVASMGWHGSEQRLYPDPTSCDYGVGFYGHSINSGSYVTRQNGQWQCWLCDIETDTAGVVTVRPRDSFHTRMYIAPLGLDVQAETGSFAQAAISMHNKQIAFLLASSVNGSALPSNARIRLATPALAKGKRNATAFTAHSLQGAALPLVRGAWEMPLENGDRNRVLLLVRWK